MSNPQNIIEDSFLILELALEVGRNSSMSPAQQSQRLLRKILSRKNISYGSIWLRSELLAETKTSQHHTRLASVPNRLSSSDGLSSELLESVDLEGKTHVAVCENKYFSIHFQHVIIIDVRGIGFLILYSNNDKAFRRKEVSQILPVIDIFGISLENKLEKDLKYLESERVKLKEIENRELKKARDMAEAATLAKASFLATMSHEIRTPLNGVVTMARILDDTKLTTDQREMTRTIRQSSESLLTIINDILDFSKIEAGKLAIETIDFDLVDQIESVADLMAPHAEEAGLNFRVELSDNVQEKGIGDPTRLRQILLNLSNNAVKFTQKGSVTLRVFGKKSTLGNFIARFEIEDTGIGMSEDQQRALFTAFQQAESSTARRFGGTGLGLAISKRLTSLMGGKIGAISKEGQGSTFWVEIPLGRHSGKYLYPRHDLSQALVHLVGFDHEEAVSLTNSLQFGGARRIAHFDPERNVNDIGDTGRVSLVILNGKLEKKTIVNWMENYQTAKAVDPQNLVLIAPHITLASLQLDWTKYPRLRYLGALTAPIHIKRLWDFVAVGTGAKDVEELHWKSTAQTLYRAPSKEIARANNAMVLVAEDNTVNKTVIAYILGRRGIAYDIADNGQIALDMLKTQQYDLLLSDLHMPMMDGFELTRTRRKLEAESQIPRLPIVAITSDVLQETAQRCQAAGMDGYLIKPIEVERLEEVLKEYLPAALDIRSRQDDGLSRPPQGGVDISTSVHALNPWLNAVGSIDRSIFTPNALIDIFGVFEEAAAELVANYVKTLPIIVAKINTAFASKDYNQARLAAHELKGASLSTGAIGLGNLAMNIESALKNNDFEAARSFHMDLDDTVEQLIQLLSGITALTEQSAVINEGRD